MLFLYLAVISATDRGLLFEANTGQFDTEVRYVARTRQASVFFTDDAAIVAMRKGEKRAGIRMTLPGARKAAQLQGETPSPFRVNSYIGANRDQWRQGIATYTRILRRGIYPGIDIAYYGTSQKELEYDFILHPGADARAIRIRFDSPVKITPNGDLQIRTAAGTLRHQRPKVYESGTHRTIAGEYKLLSDNTVGLTLASYDRTRTLIVDPVISFASLYDGEQDDVITAAHGFAMVGYTNSVSFPGTRSAAGGGYDAFLIDLNSRQITYVGGSGDDRAFAVHAPYQFGGYRFGGETNSPDFPDIGTSVTGTTKPIGGFDGWMIYSTPPPTLRGSASVTTYRFGGTGNDRVLGVGGHVVGETDSKDLSPIWSNAQQKQSGGGRDGFIWLRFGGFIYWGGEGDDALRASTEGLVAGDTDSPGLPTLRAPQPELSGGRDGFVMALTPTASVTAATYFGGSADDSIAAIAGTPENYWIAGTTSSQDLAMPSPFLGGDSDGFVARIEANAIRAGRYVGGSGADRIHAMHLFSDGELALAGETNSRDLAVHHASQPSYGGGASDGFYGAFTAALEPQVVSYHGGSGDDTITGLAIDESRGTFVLTGNIGKENADAFAVNVELGILRATVPPVLPKFGRMNLVVPPIQLSQPTRLRVEVANPALAAVTLGNVTGPTSKIDILWNGEGRTFTLEGLADSGSVEILVQADGLLAPRRFTLSLAPLELILAVPDTYDLGLQTASIWLQRRFQVRDPRTGIVHPTEYRWESGSAKVEVISSNSAVLQPDSLTNRIIPRSAGTATVKVRMTEDGIESAPIAITVFKRINLQIRAFEGTATPIFVSSGYGRVTVTTEDATSARIEPTFGRPPVDSVVLSEATQFTFRLVVPVGASRVKLRLESPGYDPLRVDMPVEKPMLLFSPADASPMQQGTTRRWLISTQPYDADPIGPLPIRIRSSNPAVLKPSMEVVPFGPGVRDIAFNVTAGEIDGEAEITAELPSSFKAGTPLSYRIQVAGSAPVAAPAVVTVGKDTQVTVLVSGTVRSSDPSKLLLSLQPLLKGEPVLEVGAVEQPVWIQALDDRGEVEVASSSGWVRAVRLVPAYAGLVQVPPEITVSPNGTGQFALHHYIVPVGSDPTTVRYSAGAQVGFLTTNRIAVSLRGGLQSDLKLTSSHPDIFRLGAANGENKIPYQAGGSQGTATLELSSERFPVNPRDRLTTVRVDARASGLAAARWLIPLIKLPRGTEQPVFLADVQPGTRLVSEDPTKVAVAECGRAGEIATVSTETSLCVRALKEIVNPVKIRAEKEGFAPALIEAVGGGARVILTQLLEPSLRVGESVFLGNVLLVSEGSMLLRVAPGAEIAYRIDFDNSELAELLVPAAGALAANTPFVQVRMRALKPGRLKIRVTVADPQFQAARSAETEWEIAILP